VNSFGVGGTNAVAVLAAPPAPTRPAAPQRPVVRLVLSARSRAELDEHSRNLADTLERRDAEIPDVAYTLRAGRHHFAERRVVTAAADRLSAALRLPRPPDVHTARVTPRRAIVVLPEHGTPPPALLEGLLGALPDRTLTVTGPLDPPPPDRFAILVGAGEPGPHRHVIALDAEVEPSQQVDGAATAAWLDGVTVDWEALSAGAGRRVPLPTYPFARRRYWALDRLPYDNLAGNGQAGHTTAATAPAAVQPDAATAAAPAAEVTPEGSLEDQLLALWRRLFGVDGIGVDQEFASLGGTSMLSVQMVLDIQREHGVLVNFQRAGGSQATIRRIAAIIRGMRGETPADSSDDGAADSQYGGVAEDGPLVDVDLQRPLHPLASTQAGGTDALLTGATGFLGAFLLHELLRTTDGRVYCVVRAEDEAAGLRRLEHAAARFGLPAPDPARVCAVPADLRDIGAACATYRNGELAARVRHVFHCAARVVFTEPYRVLRQDNVVPMVDLLNWMRPHGIRDLSFISSLVATGPVVGGNGRILERRDQPLDPTLDAYGIGKWVCERLLERADADGMRVRVFRPGLIMAASDTGACNDKDLIWLTLASGLAVGAHPTDERVHPVAPVDVVARAVVELALSAGSVGRAYHLVDERSVSLRSMFELLGQAGLPTRPLPYPQWQKLVADEARRRGSPVLSATALLELEGDERAEDGIAARSWLPWLRRRNLAPAVTGQQLYRGVAFLAERNADIAALLAGLLAESREGQVKAS